MAVTIVTVSPQMRVHMDGCADITRDVRKESGHASRYTAETLVDAIIAADTDWADAFGEEVYAEQTTAWSVLGNMEIAPCVAKAIREAGITSDDRGRPVVAAVDPDTQAVREMRERQAAEQAVADAVLAQPVRRDDLYANTDVAKAHYPVTRVTNRVGIALVYEIDRVQVRGTLGASTLVIDVWRPEVFRANRAQVNLPGIALADADQVALYAEMVGIASSTLAELNDVAIEGEAADEPAEGPAVEPETWGEALGIDEGPAFYAAADDRA